MTAGDRQRPRGRHEEAGELQWGDTGGREAGTDTIQFRFKTKVSGLQGQRGAGSGPVLAVGVQRRSTIGNVFERENWRVLTTSCPPPGKNELYTQQRDLTSSGAPSAKRQSKGRGRERPCTSTACGGGKDWWPQRDPLSCRQWFLHCCPDTHNSER